MCVKYTHAHTTVAYADKSHSFERLLSTSFRRKSNFFFLFCFVLHISIIIFASCVRLLIYSFTIDVASRYTFLFLDKSNFIPRGSRLSQLILIFTLRRFLNVKKWTYESKNCSSTWWRDRRREIVMRCAGFEA